jgi:hypothetical protein
MDSASIVRLPASHEANSNSHETPNMRVFRFLDGRRERRVGLGANEVQSVMTEAAKREEVKIGRRINHGMAANHDVIVASFPCARVSVIVNQNRAPNSSKIQPPSPPRRRRTSVSPPPHLRLAAAKREIWSAYASSAMPTSKPCGTAPISFCL